jgi:hypothetical protein
MDRWPRRSRIGDDAKEERVGTVAKSRLTAWLGKQHRKIEYAGWLSNRGPDPTLRSFTPRLASRVVLFGYHALHGRLRSPGRFHVPAPPIAKVCAIRWHARHYGLRLFVETGTAFGATTAVVAGLFEKCWTIELSEELHRRALERFSGTNVECLQGDSGALMPRIVAGLSQPALFWLDAHATGGAATTDAGYDPTATELDAIFAVSDRHVVLIDDGADQDFEVIRRKIGRNRCTIRNNIIRITPPG